MHHHREEAERRIRRALDQYIAPAVHGPVTPLTVTAFHVDGEPVSVDTARAATYEPFVVGDSWGPPWSTAWFRLVGRVPAEWGDAPVEALVAFSPQTMIGFGAEALVWGDDGPLQGLHPDHQRIPLTVTGGETVSILVEAAANPRVLGFLPTPMGDPATAPHELQYRLARADLAVLNPAVYGLWLEMQSLTDLMGELPTDEPRRHLILTALDRAIDRLDLDDASATADEARGELAEVLASPAAPSSHRVTAVGHAHIDSAWLWPLREAVRKCARTFSTATRLMDEYPEYRFACSQARQYAWMKECYPGLYARMKAKVSAGQFVPVGGMWVESDMNMPSGESLVRQLVHGQRFFADELGVECREAWLPDVFGYPASLPQILRQGGCDRFVTQKLSWNDHNRMPHSTFRWEGIDGSRVLTHFPPADTYNGTMGAAELVRSGRRFADHGRARRSLYLFGHGDGGGGPTRDMLEWARRLKDLEGVPPVTIETPSDFFVKSEAEDPNPPVWVGELYLERHRGTFTSQAATKALNRRAELALREAELWCATAVSRGSVYPTEELDKLWKALLTQQFHDILPGSSIAWVHQEAEAALAGVRARADELADDALVAVAGGLSGELALANAVTHDRAEVVALDHGPAGDGPAGDGPWQRLADGRHAGFFRVPGLGVAPAVAADPGDEVVVGSLSLENRSLRIEWDETGLLTSIHDYDADREVLSGPGNVLQLFADHPADFDAWEIDSHYEAQLTELTGVDSVTVIDRGPLVGRVRIERSFGASRVVQDVVLRAGSRRIDFETSIDWHEDGKLLKAAFPIDVVAHSARYEIQFGHVERPTHRNTSWDEARFEVCAHTWADQAEPDYGVALLNDAKYGHDIHGNQLRLTLLRAPRFPDPETDRGHHRFTYALLPHVGDWRAGNVIAEAHALNLPLRPVTLTSPRGRPRGDVLPVATVDHPGVVVSALKRADDGSGDLVIRLYEAWGQRSRCRIELAEPVGEVQRCDLLERPIDEGEAIAVVDGAAIMAELRPFELITLRCASGS